MTLVDAQSSKPTHDVALALVFHNGQWLVARRRDDVHLGGLWEFPGGKQLPGETAERAAIRELLEECGVHAAPVSALEPFICEYPDRIVRLWPVLCAWTSGTPQPLGNETCRWVASADLPALDMPAVNAGILRAAVRAHDELRRA